MHPSIAQHLTGIAALCKDYGIARLELFGSAARSGDFGDASDANFLVEFAPGVEAGLDEFFGAKVALELELELGRSVDLVEPAALRNPYLIKSINRSRELVYAA